MYKSSLDYLRQLPDVFCVNDMIKIFHLESKYAHIYISRWKKKDLIESAGPSVGFYFNLLKNPNCKDDNYSVLIKRLFPTSVLIGGFVLMNNGVTTQISNAMDIAVVSKPTRGSTLKGNGYANLERANFFYRSREWYKAKNIFCKDVFLYGLPALNAEFALVDSWLYKDSLWCPDADDIYLDDLNIRLIHDICIYLNVDPFEFFNYFNISDKLRELYESHPSIG